MILPDLLRQRVAEDPDAVALRAGDEEALTHGEWDARSNAAARGLVARGDQPGDRVALAFPNDRVIDFAVCYLAVHKAAAVAVPVGSRFSGPELERVVAHAGASTVVRSAAELEAADPVAGDQGAHGVRVERGEGDGDPPGDAQGDAQRLLGGLGADGKGVEERHRPG